MPCETCDDKFRDEWLGHLVCGGLELLFHSNHGLDTAAVHIFHDQVDFALIVEAAVVADLAIRLKKKMKAY